jgi:hypothetical protein
LGVQVSPVTVVAGTPLTVHIGEGAALGPLFVQVTVPLAVVPAGAVAGKPLIVADISDTGLTASGRVSALLAGNGSGVALPAVVVMLSGPLAGAGNVELQVID